MIMHLFKCSATRSPVKTCRLLMCPIVEPILQSEGGAVGGICVIAFRKDGLALAAYSRISGFVYVWTLQPAWAARMSPPAPPKHPLSPLSILGGMPATPSVTQLEPLRVMAAPPVGEGIGDGAARHSVATMDLNFELTWGGDGRSIVLKHEGRMLGSMAVQCP
jgi:hypothetical protein